MKSSEKLLREIVKKLEWLQRASRDGHSDVLVYWFACPICGGTKEGGHKADCALAEALKASEQSDLERLYKSLCGGWEKELTLDDDAMNKIRKTILDDILELMAYDFGIDEQNIRP